MRSSLLVLLAIACGPKEDTDSPIITTDPTTETADTATETTDTDTTPPIPCGELSSATAIGGDQADGSPALAYSPDGSMYVLVQFAGSVTYDTTELTASGVQDTALLRYTSTGELDWVRQIGGTDVSNPVDVQVLSDGGVTFLGNFVGSTTIALGEADQVVLDSVGAEDAWVASFDSGGSLSWAKSFGGAARDSAMALDVLDDDSVVVVSTHEGEATIGADEGNEVVMLLPPLAGSIASFARFSSANGELQLVEKVTGDLTSAASDVVADGGDFVVTGHLDGTAVALFGASQPGALNLQPAGFLGFIARYETDGTIEWVSGIGGWGVQAVSMAPDSSLLAAGTFSGSVTFAPGLANELVLNSAASSDVFVARYVTPGAFLWAVGSDGVPGADTTALDIAAGPQGGALLVGEFADRVRFGAGGAEVAFDPRGQSDGFAVRFDSNGNLQCGRHIGGGQMDAASAVVPRPDGEYEIAGTFADTATVSVDQADSVDLTAVGGSDVFRATYSF